jgi:acyl dehydratase
MNMHQLPDTLQPAQLTVQPELIAAYAELTQDYNPIHLDPVFAAGTPMGGVIAHGTMSIGLIWQSLERSLGAALLTGAELDIRFIQPVRVGAHLVAGGQLREAQANTYEVWVRADSDDCIVGTLTLAPAAQPQGEPR